MASNYESRITLYINFYPRHPAHWFNPVLDETIPELADKIAVINADAVVNATRMMIR